MRSVVAGLFQSANRSHDHKLNFWVNEDIVKVNLNTRRVTHQRQPVHHI